MRNTSLILLIAGCALVPCIAYASVPNLIPQQSSVDSTSTNAGSGHSSDAEHASVSSHGKDQKKTIASDKRADRRHVLAKIPTHRRPSMNSTNRAKQVRHNHQQSRPEDVTSMQKQVPTKPAAPTSKVVKIHTLPVRPATGVAISGQQFRNGRNGSATPAVIGGPANTRRNLGAINGTEVNRKHLH